MGCAITELLISHPITIEDLKGKVLAVDAHNILYQFLTTIRQRDGTPLLDKNGNITSHLTGLFNRTTSFMEKGLKLIFVFDGKAPALKEKETARRAEDKKIAKEKYAEAIEEGNLAGAHKFGARMHWLSKEMIAESKELLSALGIPCIQAPSEGEAQAAYLVSHGDAYAVVSQDADALLSGAERVIRNLSISGKRKKMNTLSYETIQPETINLSETLTRCSTTPDQLFVLAILVGTDYNIGGVKGLGPKKSLKLIKEYGTNFDALFANLEWKFPYSWKEVFATIKNIPVEKKYALTWKKIDLAKVTEILSVRHQFSEERICTKLEKVIEEQKKMNQQGLTRWF